MARGPHRSTYTEYTNRARGPDWHTCGPRAQLQGACNGTNAARGPFFFFFQFSKKYLEL